MKSKFTLLIIIAIFCNLQNVNAQNFRNPDGVGEFIFNESKTPCLTDVQREALMAEIKSGIQNLKSQNRLAFNEANRGGDSHPLFSWPIKKKDGLAYNDVWGISNYVDQNPAYPNQILDYNCGSRTYDVENGYNHAGIDIYLWPFQWKMMDNDEVEIVAAAPGQIIIKYGLNTDRSCELNGGNWNLVAIQHADGSAVIYGHMKQNSPTTKNVGDMVEEGEYLGIVGSSGNSSGPHLHFEAYSEIEWNGTGTDVLIDPYAGACNSMNTDSWWQDQKPYNNPNINAVLTHSAPPVFPTCPTQEITNEENEFETDDTIFFATYLRDQTVGDIITFEILRPDNSSLFNTWTLTAQVTSSSYYYYYGGYAGYFDMVGEWKWRVTFAGETITHTFNVSNPLSVSDENFNNTSIYPNPVNDVVTISSNSKIQKAKVVDVLGKTIRVIDNNSVDGIKEINLETLSNGLYFLTLEGDANQKKTIKLIKE